MAQKVKSVDLVPAGMPSWDEFKEPVRGHIKTINASLGRVISRSKMPADDEPPHIQQAIRAADLKPAQLTKIIRAYKEHNWNVEKGKDAENHLITFRRIVDKSRKSATKNGKGKGETRMARAKSKGAKSAAVETGKVATTAIMDGLKMESAMAGFELLLNMGGGKIKQLHPFFETENGQKILIGAMAGGLVWACEAFGESVPESERILEASKLALQGVGREAVREAFKIVKPTINTLAMALTSGVTSTASNLLSAGTEKVLPAASPAESVSTVIDTTATPVAEVLPPPPNGAPKATL